MLPRKWPSGLHQQTGKGDTLNPVPPDNHKYESDRGSVPPATFGLAGEGERVYHGALRMSILETTAVIGALSGLSGLLLGILNYLHQRDTTRPDLTVHPGVRSFLDPKTLQREMNVGIIEVRNVGHVPVMGAGIGFLVTRRGRKGPTTFAHEPVNGVDWPGELKPGHIAVLRFDLAVLHTYLAEPHGLGRAYVETMLGYKFKASRRDMRKFAERCKAAST